MIDSKVSHPKIVVIGAGSLFFGRQSIWQMVDSKYLNQGTLALVDTDEEKLSKMVRLAEMVAKENHVPLKVEGSTNQREVLKDADFVVLSFAENTVKYRGIDCQVALKYGIRMCSGDTIGPGGIFRAMRELPVIMECVKDIEELCPDAWVINYINPSAVHGIALSRYAPQLKPSPFAIATICRIRKLIMPFGQASLRILASSMKRLIRNLISALPASIISPGC